MLQSKHLIAKVRFDTAENELSGVDTLTSRDFGDFDELVPTLCQLLSHCTKLCINTSSSFLDVFSTRARKRRISANIESR